MNDAEYWLLDRVDEERALVVEAKERADAELPSQALAAATSHVDAIEHEVREMSTPQYRWHCTACGRTSVWLTAPEVSRRTASVHAQWHAEGCP